MNNIVGNFTSMEGRIGRQSWWIGAIILIVVGFILNWVLGMVLGVSYNFDPAVIMTPEGQAALVGVAQKAGWVSLIVSLVLAYPYIALGVKRRHDKDNNGMDAIVFVGFTIVWSILQGLGLTAGGMAMVGGIVGVVFLVYAIYMLVVLGFLKGTTGPNQYGADPLGGA
jgi:uncharacterized membrane protein YhaH (DUF805 family)